MVSSITDFEWNGRPWTDFGVNVSARMSVSEWLVAAGLNWNVDTQSAYRRVIDKDGSIKFIEDPQNKYLVRSTDGFVLDRGVGNKFNPIQNSDAFEVFKRYVDRGGMIMETVGSLKDDQFVWGLAKLRDGHFSINDENEDNIEGYLLMVSPHQVGKAFRIRLILARTVSWTTLSVALVEENIEGMISLRQHHISEFTKDDIEKVDKTIELAMQNMDKFRAESNLMANTEMPEADQVLYLATIFDPEFIRMCKHSMPKTFGQVIEHEKAGRVLKRIIGTSGDHPGADLFKGTVWNAFNIVTFGFDHMVSRNAENRLFQAWLDKNCNTKNKALQMAMSYALKAQEE